MENVMAKSDMVFRSEFESKLNELFPDVATKKVVSRPQLLETMAQLNTEKYPVWLMKNKVGRGLYAIEGGSPDSTPVVGNTALKPKQQESFMVDYTDTKSLIPAKDSNFVPFGNYTDLESIIKSGIFYPAYISGPTGNGKSTMVEQICAKHKRPLIRVNLNMMTDEDQLIGSKTLEDGNVKVVEGPVLIAMRTGTTLLLDEIDAGSANTLLCLQPILEGKPYYFKLKNEMIIPAEGFNILATANTKGKGSDDGRYIGTNVLNEAFLERFAVTFNQEYPSSKVEVKIIKNLMQTYSCVDEEFAETLVKWADAIRRTFEDGGVDETITTRRMIHIVRAFAIFKDRVKAVELCCNRFDVATKTAFIDLYDKVASPAPEVVAPTPKVDPSDEIPF
ncbi:COG0714 MoxR-like ATPases [uncultured Caudovirales phage]|uniref:COG0714 MoxR-like ATPases n=1 Tax=uncultured Caudovirales phage TaxID=2100421 RepID=A0A6J7WTW4_9CAUD|nr:COG0714 MoxR-like ATPases [uncultured Caudovirales phage]